MRVSCACQKGCSALHKQINGNLYANFQQQSSQLQHANAANHPFTGISVSRLLRIERYRESEIDRSQRTHPRRSNHGAIQKVYVKNGHGLRPLHATHLQYPHHRFEHNRRELSTSSRLCNRRDGVPTPARPARPPPPSLGSRSLPQRPNTLSRSVKKSNDLTEESFGIAIGETAQKQLQEQLLLVLRNKEKEAELARKERSYLDDFTRRRKALEYHFKESQSLKYDTSPQRTYDTIFRHAYQDGLRDEKASNKARRQQLVLLEDALTDLSSNLRSFIKKARRFLAGLRRTAKADYRVQRKLRPYMKQVEALTTHVDHLRQETNIAIKKYKYALDWWKWRDLTLPLQVAAAQRFEHDFKDSEGTSDKLTTANNGHYIRTRELSKSLRDSRIFNSNLLARSDAVGRLSLEIASMQPVFGDLDHIALDSHLYRVLYMRSQLSTSLPELIYRDYDAVVSSTINNCETAGSDARVIYQNQRAIQEKVGYVSPHLNFMRRLKQLAWLEQDQQAALRTGSGINLLNPYLSSKFGLDLYFFMNPFHKVHRSINNLEKYIRFYLEDFDSEPRAGENSSRTRFAKRLDEWIDASIDRRAMLHDMSSIEFSCVFKLLSQSDSRICSRLRDMRVARYQSEYKWTMNLKSLGSKYK